MLRPSQSTSALDAAIALTQGGAYVVPIPSGQKSIRLPGWQNLRLTEAELPEQVLPDGNLGILLGEPSDGLVDVDIDNDICRNFAGWLPPTGMIHGRSANPESHYWYRIIGAVPATAKFEMPAGDVSTNRRMLIELRSTGGQTVVPPSRYDLGDGQVDQLRWDSAAEPAPVESAILIRAVRKIAAASLLALKWPGVGSRHKASMALAGALLRNGWSEDDAEDFIFRVAEAAGDEEAEERGNAVATTAKKLQAGANVTGIPSLMEVIDEKWVTKAVEWLALGAESFDFTTATAAPLEWPEPVLLHEPNLPDMPASLLPAPYGPFADALAQSTETPGALSILAILAIVSAAVAKKYIVTPQSDWAEPVNIYTLVALPPANNKSQIVKRCTEPLLFWEGNEGQKIEPVRLQALSKKRNLEALIASTRAKAAKCTDPAKQAQLFADVLQFEGQLKQLQVPPLPKLFVNDVTPEALAEHVMEQDSRMAVISDEGGFFETIAGLYSNGRSNYDLVLKGYDGGDVRIDRKGKDSIHLRPYLTLALIVQPKVLKNLGERQALQGKGLQERFLFAIPPSKLGSRSLNGQPVPPTLAAGYEKAVRDLLNVPLKKNKLGTNQPTALPLSASALSSWQAWRHEIEPSLAPEGELSPCLGWGGKLAGTTLRLAGLIELMNKGPAAVEVTLPSMENAITLAKLLIPHALEAFGMMRENPDQELAERVLKKIRERNAPTISKTDLYRALRGGIPNVKKLDDALKLLEDRGIVRGRDEVTTKGKRPTRLYDVNPAVLKQ